MDRIPERIDSTFRFVLIAARRAEQLLRGARPKIEQAAHDRPTRIALREIREDLVEWEYGPPPMPEPESLEEEVAEETAAP